MGNYRPQIHCQQVFGVVVADGFQRLKLTLQSFTVRVDHCVGHLVVLDVYKRQGLAVKDIFLFRRKVRLWNKNALRGIALRRKGRCRLRGPPQAESFASETLFYIQYNKNR